MMKLSLSVFFIAIWALLAPSQGGQTKDILTGSKLEPGFGMGVNSSSGRTDWLKKEDGFMSMSYPADQEWGAVFITIGKPKPSPHPAQDFSTYKFLSVEMKGQTGKEEIEVGVKTNTQADDGSETKLPVKLSSDWKTYNFALSQFTGTNTKNLYVVIEFVFGGDAAQTVFFRNVKYAGAERPPPPQDKKGKAQNDGASDPKQKRIALVIGNQDYRDAPLLSPVNDARDVARTLEACGFEVFSYENLTRQQMEERIRDFGAKLSPASVALFYFAGHGLQVNEVNYLVPVKHNIRKEADVEYEAVNVGRVLAEMEAAKTRMNIIILDACRNNPFRSFGVTSPGLASMNAPGGSIIAYATAPNDIAIEESDHGIYTRALVEAMREPCLEIEPMFKKVRARVGEETKGRRKPQVPWENTSLIGAFHFVSENCGESSLAGSECSGRQTGNAKSFSVDKNFEPSGKMGDIDDVRIIRLPDSIQFEYRPQGRGAHEWEYKYVDGKLNPAPAQFGGAILLAPGTRFGTVCGGFDLRRVRRTIKWEARSLQNDEVKVAFVIGGINWIWDNGQVAKPPYPDSLPKKELATKRLIKEWQTFTADLSDESEAAFRRVLAGFAWAITWDENGLKLNRESTGVDKRRVFKIEIRNVRYEANTDESSEAHYVSQQWQAKASSIVWVDYSSPSANPEKGIEPTPEDIRKDLSALRRAGFTGLVTYGSKGVMGSELAATAESLGFKGMIAGVWDPTDKDELEAAKSLSQSPIVVGYCVGNEGLGKRYELPSLLAALREMRQATAKPVTTTEELEDYADDALMQAGDWVFPNVHPYFHRILDPSSAVRWTRGAYEDLTRRSRLFVLLKEVGLPTSGDATGRLSEAAQDYYYAQLAKTPVKFVFFEAFDQPWKQHLPVEPHWGIFRADRTPKLLALRLLKKSAAQHGGPHLPDTIGSFSRTTSWNENQVGVIFYPPGGRFA